MKKRVLALLVASLMLASMMPTVGMAALESYANDLAFATFDGYKKNTTTALNDAGNVDSTEGIKPKGGIRVGGAGTAVDYEPVTGLFGKSADDVSVKATRIQSSTADAYIGPIAKLNSYGCTGRDEYIDINWEWAFGDMNVERYLEVKFYNPSKHIWNQVNSFSYTGSANNADILRLSPNGAVRFFGKTLENNYYFNTNTWYHFDIRIKVGTNTSDATEEIPASKAVAYLYVDGILIGEKEINNAPDDAAEINNPHCIYRADFKSKAVKLSGSSEALSEVTYIDNIYSGKYKEGANTPCWPWMRDYTITSKSDNFITDGIHIALKNPQTAAELKADLSYIAGDNTGIGGISIVDANRAALADDAQVTPGCFIKAQTKSGGYWHYWYRKITDRITYINNSYDYGVASSTPTSKYNYAVGSYSSTVNYGPIEKKTPDKITIAQSINKYGTGWAGALGAYHNTGYKGTVDADKYVVEAKILRDAVSDDYANLAFRINSRTWVSVSSYAVTIHADDDSWPPFIWKSDKTDNRWIKIAVEVDAVQNIAKIYINGEDTGITKSAWGGSNCYSSIGILTDCTGKLQSAFGTSYIDDIKVYSGSYDETPLEVTSNDENIVPSANDTLVVQNEITVEQLKAATGAKSVYAYADGEFGAEITAGTLPDGAVAIFASDDNNIVKYYDVVYPPVISDVTFDTTSESGKIAANVTFNNRSAMNLNTNAVLLIAAYDNSGSGKKLTAVDVCKVTDMTIGEYPLSAKIDFDNSKEIVAYLWKTNNAPYCEAVPYIE